jgi:hypothetical protein
MKAVIQTHQTDYQQSVPQLSIAGKTADRSREDSAHVMPPKEPSMPRQSAELMQQRHRQIAELAYYKAQQRGFEPGHELEDWLAAEAEVDKASRPLELY